MVTEAEDINLKIVAILTLGFALGSVLGYTSQRLKLSPILGYLLAGYLIGPFSPGLVVDLGTAEELAEVGVMLMMFGVGLHFKWQDLLKVKNIAIPGALGQTLVAAAVSTVVVYSIEGAWEIGLIMGLAIGVASTVVLVRVLSDQKLLNTVEGHIAVGWLIVEDILTVAVLILLPTLASFFSGASISLQEILAFIALLIAKFVLLAALMFTLGLKIVSYILFKVARLQSHELFTLTMLALIFVIATGSALLFGTSIALGAFIAGMVIGQTDVRHQASAHASPLKDAFVVIFFLSVGMLFNPKAIVEHFSLFISVLAIIFIVKPLAAFLIVILLRYPAMTALTIAIALAQIGEFSFILAEEALKFNIFTDEGYDVIVACALISISLNPLFFKWINEIRPYMENRLLPNIEPPLNHMPQSTKALIIGYGAIGETIVHHLENRGVKSLIIDRNVDTVAKLKANQQEAIYGEASHPKMLEMAKIESFSLLIITISHLHATLNIIKYAREIHPSIVILARARHLEERERLIDAGARFVCCDDEETSHGFEKVLLQLEELHSF
jgi:CPA2 family monovalent cation:H+ antiporter-2